MLPKDPSKIEEYKKKISLALKGKPKKYTVWNKGKRGCYTEDTLHNISESLKGRHPTEETRKKLSEARKGKSPSEETRRKIGLKHKGKIITPEQRKQISNTLKGNKNASGKRSEEFCKLRSIIQTGKRPSLETRMKTALSQKGSKSHFWLGGLTKDPYPDEWTHVFKREIRERDGYTCQVCGYPGRCIHHIDYNKQNLDPDNLITLCAKDHARTNFYRKEWQESLLAIVEERKFNEGKLCLN
jgi:hypothetical protein